MLTAGGLNLPLLDGSVSGGVVFYNRQSSGQIRVINVHGSEIGLRLLGADGQNKG